MKATINTLAVMVAVAGLLMALGFGRMSAAEYRARQQVASAQANLEQERARLAAEQEAHQAALEQEAAAEWRGYEAAWIAPAWAGFYAMLPTAGALVVGTLALGVVGALVVAADQYRLRRRPLVWMDGRGTLPVDRGDVHTLAAVAVGLMEEHAKTQRARALASVEAVRPVPHSLHYAPHYSHAPAPALPAPTTPEAQSVVEALPEAPAYSEILADGWQPTPKKMLLGYGASGPIYGPIGSLLSVGIAGRPGQGKSSLLRFVYCQHLQAGGAAAVWDLHGSIAGDLGGAAVYSEVETIEHSAKEVIAELERRRHGATGPAVLVLVDEWPLLSLASKPAIEAARRLVLEGRKYGMFTLVSGQGLAADSFGGSLVRDALSSRYIFRTSPAEARRCGLEKEDAKRVLSLIPGRAILAGPVDPQVVSIPWIEAAEVAALARPLSPAEQVFTAPVWPSSASSKPVPSQFQEVELGESLSDGGELAFGERAGEVYRALLANQESQSQIIRRLWGVQSGAAFQRASQEYQQIIVELLRRGMGTQAGEG